MDESRGIGKRALRGIRWTLLTTAVSNILKLVVIVVLGRLLDPDEFGVVAAAFTVVQLARMVRDLGVGMALVQRETVEFGHIQTSFGFTLLLGAILTVAILVSAPFVAEFYRMPEVTRAVQELSVLFILMSLSTVPVALCQRDLEFKKLALVDLVCYACGSSVAIGLAYGGLGAHSLTIGYLVEAGLTAVIMLGLRPVPFPRLRWHELRDLIGFGSGMTVARIGVYLAEQGDRMIIGRQLDAFSLGLYTRAYDIITYPSAVYHSIVGTVLFPSFSRMQGDPERLGRAFRRALFANAVLLLPASAGLFVLAPELVSMLMGPGWESAVLPFQVIAVSLHFRVSYKIGQIIMMSSGESYQLAIWQFVYAAMIIGGAAIGVRWGVTGVSCTTAAAMTIHFFNLTRLARVKTTLRWREIAGSHVQGIIAVLLTISIAWPLAHLLRDINLAAPLIVLVCAFAGSIVLLFAFARGRRNPASDWSWLAGSLRGALRPKRS